MVQPLKFILWNRCKATTNYWSPPLFQTVQASMNDARYAFTATNMTNGKILVAGGAQLPNTDTTWQSSNLLSSCEIYSNGVWTYTGNLSFPRAGHQVWFFFPHNICRSHLQQLASLLMFCGFQLGCQYHMRTIE